MRGTTARRPSDRELAELAGLVTDTLHRVDEAELAQPATTPDWARLRAGMIRGRRRWPAAGRRAVVLGAAVAVTLIGTGIAAGIPSDLFRQHAPSSKDQQAYSALYELPIKGALKNDSAWLSALQSRLASGAAAGTSSMAGYRPADPDQIRIEFAGDVGEYRLALAEGRWTDRARAGANSEAMQWWLQGPAGASPEQMVAQTNVVPPGDTAITIAGPDTTSPAGDPGTSLVVVSARPVPVKLVTGRPVIDAQARITVSSVTLLGSDNSYTTHIPAGDPDPKELYVDGKLAAHITDAGDQTRDLFWTKAMRTPSRGGPIEPITPALPNQPGSEQGAVADFGRWLSGVVLSNRSDGTFQLLASIPTMGDTGKAGRSMAGVLTLPSGARVFGVLGVGPQPEDAGQYAMTWLMAATLELASTSLDDLAMVWVNDKEAGSVLAPSMLGWSGAIGPAGTTTVEWQHGDGTTTTSTAQHSMAVTHDTAVTGARFLDANGRLLATRPVTPAPSSDGRLVVLPEIAQAMSR